MEPEYEVKFLDIQPDEIRQILKKANATLIYQEFLQKRFLFNFPKGHEIESGRVRVREEKDKITMSIKANLGEKIEDQKEIQLEINDLKTALVFLETLGCTKKAYVETKRELWELDGADISIDTWPFLDPFIEIESKDKETVKKVSEKLGFDYKKGIFSAVDTVYYMKYNVSEEVINKTETLTFESKNPFI